MSRRAIVCMLIRARFEADSFKTLYDGGVWAGGEYRRWRGVRGARALPTRKSILRHAASASEREAPIAVLTTLST